MRIQLSLPVERLGTSKLARKHQQHGTPIGALIPDEARESLGVPDMTAVLNAHLRANGGKAK